ncbi:MAG: LytTR family transcriptional regulator [Marinicaulis sp.]|nr:LytTR family transcriptional regulator [Marinicaulis sp.]
MGWAPLGLSYLIILGLFVDITGLTLVTTWVANVLFPSIAGIGVVWVVLSLLIHQTPRVQIGAHTLGAIVFSTVWALTTFRLLQAFAGLTTGVWSAPNWPSPVVAWQLFQGLAIYFTIVSVTYAYWALTRLTSAETESVSLGAPQRIYAKTNNGLVPLIVNDICAARTIDGLSYLFVGRNKLESRMTLAELEAALPDEQFLRIHRSAIINLDQIQSIEPAGNGRQTIHLTNGETIETSRAGSAILKARVSLV